MGKILTFTLAIAVCLGTTGNSSRATQRSRSDWQLASDGAFRDGLYLGGLTARQGRPAHPAIGRWSTPGDRASFLAGYRRGYDDAANRALTVDQNRAEYIRKFGI